MFKNRFSDSHVGRVYRCRYTDCRFEVGATFVDDRGLVRCVGQWTCARPHCSHLVRYQIHDADLLDNPKFFSRVLDFQPAPGTPPIDDSIPRVDLVVGVNS